MKDERDYIEIVFHPDVTRDQIAGFLEIVGDLFEASGGKGGLKVIHDEEEEAPRPMRLFGPERWGLQSLPRCETPVGSACTTCEEVIGPDDRGMMIDHFADGVTEKPMRQFVD